MQLTPLNLFPFSKVKAKVTGLVEKAMVVLNCLVSITPLSITPQILRHSFGQWHRLGRGRIFVKPCRSFRSEEESGVGEKGKNSEENFGKIKKSNVVEAERRVNKFVGSVRNAVWRVSKPSLRSQGEFRESLEKLEEKLFSGKKTTSIGCRNWNDSGLQSPN